MIRTNPRNQENMKIMRNVRISSATVKIGLETTKIWAYITTPSHLCEKMIKNEKIAENAKNPWTTAKQTGNTAQKQAFTGPIWDSQSHLSEKFLKIEKMLKKWPQP